MEKENQIITFSQEITADESSRTISGKIVPVGTGEIGHASGQRVVFENGAINLPKDASQIKLLNQHNKKEPIGKAIYFNEVPNDGIYASFKVSRSQRGTDALILAEEGIQSGLSVGVNVIRAINKAGVLHVQEATLFETSLVTEPAFKSAQVTEIAIAASEDTGEESSEVAPTPTTESEQVVENTTTDNTAAPEVETVAVEAAAPSEIKAARAPIYTRDRVKPITSSEYLGLQIKAAVFKDEDAARTILAADDSTGTNTGLTLPSHLSSFVTTTFSGRPAVDACSVVGAPPQLSFTIPKLGTAPTVAETAEAAAPSETGMTSSYDTITTKKYAGLNRVSFELLDFSNPAFESLLLAELRKGYEKATDEAVIAAFTASGVQATGVAATAAGLQSFIATQAAAAYKATGGDKATNLVASTDQWAAIMGYVDTTGRALYTASNPINNSGATAISRADGDILGARLYVDHNISVAGIVDESAFLVAPESVWIWETPQTNLRVNVLTSGEVEIELYGYMAIGVLKGGAGVRRFNLA